MDGTETTEQVAYGETPAYDGTPTKASTDSTVYTFTGWSPAIAAVTGDATYVAQFNPVPKAATVISIALNTNAVGTVANGSLAATGVSGKNVTVSADFGDATLSGAVAATATPNGTIGSASAGVATATFPAEWNAGVEWTIADSAANSTVAPLVGKSYLKAETQWFTTDTNAVSPTALTTTTATLGFGDDIEAGVVPAAASPAGEQVRIQMRIEVSATGSDSAPAAADMGDARGGITVVTNMYHAFNGNSWVPLTGATPIDGTVDLLMVADMGAATPAVRYYIDGVALYDNSDATPVYAIPLKTVAEGNTALNAVGISNEDALKSAITAEYDVPYVAAKVATGYTTPADAVAAADKTGNDVLELLADVSGEIALTDGQSVQVKLNGFTGPTFTTSETGKQVVGTLDQETGVTTYALAAQTFLIQFVNYNNTVLQSDTLAYGATPAYTNATPVKPEDAQNTYTFSGWDPAIATVTEAATYTAQFSATPKATGAVSGGVTILNTEELAFTSIAVDGNTVTVNFTATIVVADGTESTANLPFGILYKTALTAAEPSTAPNAASVTLTKSQGEVFDGGTAVITLPSGVTNSFFLFGFADATDDNANSGD